MNKLAGIVLVGIASLQTCILAQVQSAAQLPDCKKRLDLIRQSTEPDQKKQRIDAALRYEENSSCFAEILFQRRIGSASAQGRAFTRFVQDFEARRNDKQTGSGTGTGGSTNLVSKGLTAQAVSVAAEYGALTQSVNNQVVTVQGSLGGFASALARQKLIEYCPSGNDQSTCLSRAGLDFLKRISYGVSFDTSRSSESVSATPSGQQQGTVQPVTFTANRHQISSWTGRIALWNTRDTNSDAFKTKWTSTLQAATGAAGGQGSSDAQNPSADQIKAAGADLLKSFQSFIDSIKFGTSYTNALAAAVERLQRATAADLDSRFDEWADEFIKMLPDNPALVDNAVDLLQARSVYLLAEDELVSALADKPVLSFEYNNNRPVSQDPTSTFRLIFDRGIGKKWSITSNGAFTIYDTRPKLAKATRLRDAQLGLQIQRDIGKLFAVPAAVAATYYFQYQNGPAILNVTPGTPLPGITFTGLPANATQVFAETGNLHLGQLRLVLTPGKSSVRVPFAVSYSNRTELIAKPAWRAQVGISYDFDALLSK